MEADRDRTLREMSVGELLLRNVGKVCCSVRGDRRGDLAELGHARRQTSPVRLHPSMRLTRS